MFDYPRNMLQHGGEPGWAQLIIMIEFDDSFRIVINEFEDEDSAYIRHCKNLMEQPELYIDLSFLNTNYGKLSSVIEKFKSRNICLYDTINIFENTIQSIENVQVEIGNEIATKSRKSLHKNFNYQKLKVSQAYYLELHRITYIYLVNIHQMILHYVKRIFSVYNSVLRPNRQVLTMENIKYYMIIHVNK